ncbi:hypothetical protein PHYBLDRAFT_154832 [Phycomyces blakesleeanus NRRL 1555(-)]|uniref:Adenosine deaminase domain-containing protein n=1 Tax=Phycomyces blakesleeanus (strain ATCC 8743b / DSM 1359 / FGSC 10004 / NBRC 33097 / NRRL 1555) TaxID=763407 RepID=A0A167NF63_PHYB8|nr:hypothetical protein PHYBLDRAFT_154832 [Phycomyces blakesleeanus NRRL 1555(-)]OAD75759.1 hypothetical protein PHYBLDRAFT_154832 [Phycomyces blakesleeanus NRRL 1555(-)]|eukprot:XP_018293799.1 hypothetical protein PHYBLDRAFT_154832 [Phycomyces blakesleeanus NRRL 1555(-)]
MNEFCVQLPKVELHAHINGSLSPDTMRVLVERKKDSNPSLADFRIPDSLERIDDFFPLFRFIYQLTDDEPSVVIATRNVISDFERDGVRYLELRTTPRENPATGMTKKSYLAAVLSAINEVRKSIVVRLIVSIDRRDTLEKAQEAVDLALHFRSQGVVGIDLCGHVMEGSFVALRPAFDRAKQHGFPLTLHFGEVKENMAESLELLSIQPNRLGHATFLTPERRENIYAGNIPVEICMTSNILCKTTSTYEEHHIKDLLVEKHPFIICTDDKGVFFSQLSDEYTIAAKTFGLSKNELYEASYRTIDAIFEDETIKQNLKKIWSEWYKDNLATQ